MLITLRLKLALGITGNESLHTESYLNIQIVDCVIGASKLVKNKLLRKY